MALSGMLVCLSKDGLTNPEGHGEGARSPQLLPLLATVSVHPDPGHGHLGCDTLTYVDGHIDMLRIVHEVTKCHEGFLPCQQVLRLQLFVELGQGPTAIGNGGLGRVDVRGQVHGDPGMGHASTPAEDSSLALKTKTLQNH